MPNGDDRPEPSDLAAADPGTEFGSVLKRHYDESGGYSCGFHGGPNSQSDRWLWSQERPDPNTESDYEPATLNARSPTAVLWELLGL